MIDAKTCADSTKILRIGAFYRPGNLVRIPQAKVDQVKCEEIRRNLRTICIIMAFLTKREYRRLQESPMQGLGKGYKGVVWA